MTKKFVIPILCALALTGCVNREQADAKLERGCAAAAGVFSEEGFAIESVKESTFGPSKEFGNGFREVKITVIESDGWADLEKPAECIFIEDMGAFGLSHSADLHRLKIDDNVYGVENADTTMAKILGDMETHVKITTAVEKAMTMQK